jgi:hypothetical protein
MAGTEKQREEINRKLVTMQMEMIGLTYEDAMNTPEWYRVYSLTPEQEEEWRRKALPLIKKTFKCNKQKALLTMHFFELNLGLRTDLSEQEEVNTTTTTTTVVVKQVVKRFKPTWKQRIRKFFTGMYD